MRILAFALLLLAAADARAQEEAAPAARRTALTARLVLKVVHPDEVRQTVLKEVAAAGGFPVLVTERALTLKAPPDRLDDVLRGLATHGVVLEKTLARADLTQSIAQLEARLRSKFEILGRLRQLIDDSDVAATLNIERNMSALVQEMEAIKGSLRVETERARWAVVDLAFDFRERERLVYVHSPFDWLNTVDVGRFNADFRAH